MNQQWYWTWHKLSARWREKRASSILDPVERLRYLRRTVCEIPPAYQEAPAAGSFRGWGIRWAVTSALAVAFVASPALLFREVHARSAPAAKAPEPELRGPAIEVVIPKDIPAQDQAREIKHVWLVETLPGQELYSNGLRIETSMTIANEPRIPRVHRRRGLELVPGAKISGIVFHTTESHMSEFAQANNTQLRMAGRYLLDYVQRIRCYNYLIDRFGRVHRVVREEDAAWHAGESIWGDDQFVYSNLNHTFIGVSFESQTIAGSSVSGATEAQVQAARALTGMLRSKYGIHGYNCVTHAQVSLNPDYFLIGLHTDWAANFPFSEVGVPDNYGRVYASITEFGFGYDDNFVRSTGTRMLTGLALSEEKLRRDAAAAGAPLDRHRAGLHQRYRNMMAALAPPAQTGEATRKDHNP